MIVPALDVLSVTGVQSEEAATVGAWELPGGGLRGGLGRASGVVETEQGFRDGQHVTWQTEGQGAGQHQGPRRPPQPLRWEPGEASAQHPPSPCGPTGSSRS